MIKRVKNLLIGCIVLSVLIVFAITMTAAVKVEEAGAATDWYTSSESAEYEITTADELAGLADLVNSGIEDFSGITVKLTKDVNLSEYNSGTGWTPIGNSVFQFKGTFDGKGHKITGLYINNTNLDYIGLFGCLKGTVKNLDLENVNIIGRDFVGGIAGSSSGSGINTCHVSGAIKGRNAVGGIAGELVSGIVSDCRFSGEVAGIDSYSKNIGGIAGYNNADILNSYATGNDPEFPLWILGFAIIPIFLLILLIPMKIRSGNLKRKTAIDITNEKIKHYGLDKVDDSVLKNKISLLSISEIRERIRQNRENKREERIRLQNRSNYNFYPDD